MTQIHSSNEEALLHQMVETIVREVSPETIILFGSRARGDARPDSDVDLLIVETEPFSPQRSRRKEAARLYMALKGLPVSKDILLYSRDEFEHWKNSVNHVVGRAHREGRVLHGRARIETNASCPSGCSTYNTTQLIIHPVTMPTPESNKHPQSKNPLQGVTLETLLIELHAQYGWEGLAKRIDINCFKQDPSIKSSLKFLRKTPWAREKVEALYIQLKQGKS